MDLKAETIGLAVMLELPLVVVDVQRAGPSTGMPTKTEQADLLMAMYGRHGESPLPVIAASTPADCFDARGRGGADRGPLPHAGDPALRHLPRQLLRALAAARRRRRCPRSTPTSPTGPNAGDEFLPYLRDEQRRPPLGDPRHARPAAPDRRPREGGRQRQHQLRPRQPRADDASCAPRSWRSWPRSMPPLEVDADEGAELLVLGWGSTYGVDPGAPRGGCARAGHAGRHRPPAPPRTRCRRNTGEVLRAYPQGAGAGDEHRPAAEHLRAEFLVDAIGYNKVEGLPIFAEELERRDPGGLGMSENGHGNGNGSALPTLTKAGLPVRPGDALVPGLRRLRDPRLASSR